MLHCVRTILNAIWVDDKKDDESATTGRMNDSEPWLCHGVPAATSADAEMRARAPRNRVNVLVSYSIRIMAGIFRARVKKKSCARLRFRFEFHLGLGFRREGGQV